MDDYEAAIQRLAQGLGMLNTASNDFDLSSQLKLVKDNMVPECYNASNYYSSFTNKAGFIHTFNAQAGLDTDAASSFKIFQSTRPAIEHGVAPSIFSIKDLRHVTIQQVVKKVNHIHTDSVMFLTVTHVPYRQVGTSLLVEDDKNDCIMLSLYNYVATDEDPKNVFPVGTRLALLAPYLKNSQDDRSKNLMLRCDNPQCVVAYDDEQAWMLAKHGDTDSSHGIQGHEEKKKPSVLREKGNKEFGRGNLSGASSFYSKALNYSNIDNEAYRADKVACLSNRAEVRLRQARWEDATKDAQNVLSMQADNAKAKFRLAKALVRQGRSSEALVLGKELIDQNPECLSSIHDFVKECYRLGMEESGSYDYESMRREAGTMRSRENLNFHADFVSPSVETGVMIQCLSGISYRGVKAVKDLAEDELVVASKAFAYFTREENDANTSLEFNTYEKTMNDHGNIQLVGEVVKLLWKSPSLGKSFYSLSAGDDCKEINLDDMDKIDLPRIRNILKSNVFSQTSENESISVKWKSIQHMKKHGRPMSQSEFKQEVAKRDATRGSGLWLKESLFNHSCTPNCIWTQIGDHMFIRTTKAIQKDEELCISYAAIDGTYEVRKNIFANWIRPNVGFSCACDHCHLFRTQENLRQLAAEVDTSYEEAAKEVTLKGIPMATAAESAMPSKRRKSIMKHFAHLPPRLQHNSIAKLHLLDGSFLKSRGDHSGALRSFERAADIGYAVRGTAFFDYLTDLWRITGAAMACKMVDLAHESLGKIWNGRDFQSLSPGEAKIAFMDLSLKYAMPWWRDEHGMVRQVRMENLIDDVCNKKAQKSKLLSTRKRKKKGKR